MVTNDANCTNVRTRAHHHKIDVFSLEFSIVPIAMANTGQGNMNDENILKRIVDRIRDKLGEDVLSIVLFGSTTRGEFTESSDIDVLVIARNLPDDWRDRDKILLELAEIRSGNRRPVHITLTDEYEMNASIDQGAPLVFGLHDANRVIFGRDGFFEKLMKQFEGNMKRWGVRKIGNGEWFAPGLAVIDV